MRDGKIVQLKQRLQPVDALLITEHSEDPVVAEPTWHIGHAPLIDSFTGEKPDALLDNWLPLLERAATQNGWTKIEWLLHFAGHLWENLGTARIEPNY